MYIISSNHSPRPTFSPPPFPMFSVLGALGWWCFFRFGSHEPGWQNTTTWCCPKWIRFLRNEIAPDRPLPTPPQQLTTKEEVLISCAHQTIHQLRTASHASVQMSLLIFVTVCTSMYSSVRLFLGESHRVLKLWVSTPKLGASNVWVRLQPIVALLQTFWQMQCLIPLACRWSP